MAAPARKRGEVAISGWRNVSASSKNLAAGVKELLAKIAGSN
jgi:hypothetical protein